MKTRVHWNIQKKQWTTQTYKGCTQHDAVFVDGNWTTEVNPNAKSNPRGHVVCDSSQVSNKVFGAGILTKYTVSEKLIYDKDNMKFNIESGNGLLFIGNDCYTLIEKQIEEKENI